MPLLGLHGTPMRTTNYGWGADAGNAENGNYIKLITASLDSGEASFRQPRG